MTIYKNDKAQPIAVCELAVEEKDLLVDLAGRTKIKDEAKNSLLLTLCWYFFIPHKRSGRLNTALRNSRCYKREHVNQGDATVGSRIHCIHYSLLTIPSRLVVQIVPVKDLSPPSAAIHSCLLR